MTNEEETEDQITSHETEERNRQQNVSQKRTRFDEDLQYEASDLKQETESVIKLIVPVSVCMLIVILSLGNIDFFTEDTTLDGAIWFVEAGGSKKPFSIWVNVVIALFLIIFIIIITFILIALYVYRFYKVLKTWFVLTTLLVLFIFSYIYFEYFLKTYNLPMDIFTAVLLLWNFGTAGIICIYWKGPLKLRQVYLTLIAARIALEIIKTLSGWTIWILLFLVSIWDIVAVLAPIGPLKILVETALERNESLFPSLIYSTVVYNSAIAIDNEEETESNESISNSSTTVEVDDNEHHNLNKRSNTIEPTNTESPSSTTSGEPRKRKLKRQRSKANKKRTRREDGGAQLGLGDFIFYSILLGKAYMYGTWISAIACYVAILIGLCITFILLLWIRTVLPALPISVALGLVFHLFFGGTSTVHPFHDLLELNQIFI
ncbi:presenilin homolog isoform X2 [Planococcus citri]|uniref:presenilin homolog isoform X2 n=1 Tax=Planococcus citri TaxID=170843 RepID=UPI0031F75CB2